MEVITKQDRFQLISTNEEIKVDNFASDVKKGLTSEEKFLLSKYFYDEKGSQLFEQISDLDEYYLTRTEREILESKSGEISTLFSDRISMVELGSGSSEKTRLLIKAFLKRFGNLFYIPIDISLSILEESSLNLLADFPGLDIQAINATYQKGLRKLHSISKPPRLILFLGSNIGNFQRHDAENFLHCIQELMHPTDRLLAGIDLKKDKKELEAAYNDSLGVTAKFNLNLLERINRELGGEFDLNEFKHLAIYNENIGRIEMHLVSKIDQTVHISDINLDVPFKEGETIHTENSYKYSLQDIDELAQSAGLLTKERWLDANERFSLNFFASDRK